MKWIPSGSALQLFHEGQIALSEVEGAGVRIDREYLESTLSSVATQIKQLEEFMRADPLYKAWRKRYGDNTNIGSSEQLSNVVIKDLGLRPKFDTEGKEWTEDSGKRASASKSSLEAIDHPFVKAYFQAQQLRKGRDTFLVGIHREMIQHDDGDWWVHPSFHLNTVATFRSSSSDPNWMNNPTRNPALAEMVRRCYLPRRGHQILELDYGQIEVRIPCAYTHDPSLIAYCCDPTKDMHRDVGEQLFMLKRGELSKAARHVAKNQFTFPTFYGSYYAQMTPDMWDSIAGLTIEGSNQGIREHLAANGIEKRGVCDPRERPVQGTFEYHVKEIEDHFWTERFPVYAQWKKDWYAAYLRDGGCRFLTGFIMKGPHAKNDVTNYPVQSVAFHCLLWSMTRIVNRLRRYKMRTRVIGEIHDSLELDTHPSERDDVIDMCIQIMTEEIKRWAPWLNVPLVVEAECCPVDKAWFYKHVLVKRGGVWVPDKLDKWEQNHGSWSLQC